MKSLMKGKLKLNPKGISIKNLKGNKKKIAIVLILLIIIVIGGHSFLSPKEQVITDYIELQKEDLVKNVNVLGNIESNEKVNVYSTLNNVVKEVNVKVGDKVNKGDILCILDSSELEREISQTSQTIDADKQKAKIELDTKKQTYENAEYIYNNNIDSSLTDCEEALKVAKIKLDDSQKDYNQKETLFENGAATQKELDDAKSVLEQSKSDYDKCCIDLENRKIKSKQEVEDAKNQYNSALVEYNNNKDEILLQGKKEDLDKCIISAPISGTITTVNASVGNAAQGILFTVENLDDPVITVNVKEVDINKIMPGQEAEVTTDATPDDDFALGKVVSLSDAVNTNNDSDIKSGNNSSGSSSTSNTFEAKIKLDNPSENDYIKVGMNAKANIILEKSENVFAVPFTSILEENDEKFIKIAKERDDGKYEICKIPITTGLETDMAVEIDNSDLKEGDKLISDPNLYDEGEIVTLAPLGGDIYE